MKSISRVALFSVMCAFGIGVASENNIPDVSTLDSIYKQNKVISRVPSNDVVHFYKVCQEQGIACSAELIDDSGLTDKGKEVLQVLNDSPKSGLKSKLYHVDVLHKLLDDSNHYAEKRQHIEYVLVMAGITYVRDMGQGMPELKRSDDNWKLEGRAIKAPEKLVEIIVADDTKKSFQQLEPSYPEYRALKSAYQSYLDFDEKKEPITVVPHGQVFRKGMMGDNVNLLRKRLIEIGELDESYQEGNSYDEAVEKAIKSYQEKHVLLADGIAGAQTIASLNLTKKDYQDQIRVNLERWRWMPEKLESHYLVVEIPKYEYYIKKDNKEVIRAKTVVGMKSRKTPVFKSHMSYLVFSPYWHVPRSMAVNDQLPRLKQDPYRLTRSKIRIFDRSGHEVDPGMVDWSQYNRNNFPFSLRQDPGNYNSLGRVKFMFPNQYAIYLHDTPQRYLFDLNARARSSGCVRVENPTELAMYFLKDAGWTEEKIKSAYNRSSEATVSLNKEMKFPVYTLYFTAEVEDDVVKFYPDIYDRDLMMIRMENKVLSNI